MKELVLDLINSYEDRLSTVEELITTTYRATVASEGSFGVLDEEREKLKSGLQKTLAKNCSLRRKDFDRLMESFLSDSGRKRRENEEERKGVIESIKGYLDEQKRLVTSLRQQLELAPEETATGDTDTLSNIKAAYQDTGQQILALLRSFQSHLLAFQRDQEEINQKLQRLADRGESLRIEDLRQLEAASAHQDRKTERELRRCEVERLLACFKRHRENSRQ